MRNLLGQAQEVAAQIDGKPIARAHVSDGVPARRVDAGGESATVEKRARDLAAESERRWIEPEQDSAVEELDHGEAESGVERGRGLGEEIHAWRPD